ncbi:MAG TPA: universal stress protein, partial [Gammaproteobacteria bacterium]|nr:universal stress protein [Gammaproteobacteria bacterium]
TDTLGPAARIALLHVGDDDFPFRTLDDLEHLRRSGDPVEQILGAADRLEADLIVMATAGHHGVFDALRGSTTERVLRRSPCPLLAVPIAAEAERVKTARGSA